MFWTGLSKVNFSYIASNILYVFKFSREILNLIENIILEIVTSLSKDEAPVLTVPNRSSWANVRLVTWCKHLGFKFFPLPSTLLPLYTHLTVLDTCNSPGL